MAKPRPQKAGALPPPPPPPPAPKRKTAKPTSTNAVFNAYINAHPIMKSYAPVIVKWAKAYHVDPVVMAALYWRESFAVATSQKSDPATIQSSAGAVGIGQIMPLHIGEKTPWGQTVTAADLRDPNFNIRWSTWYFGQQISKYGSVDAAYNRGYNPGYQGPSLSSTIPKGYVPTGGLTPAEQGSVSAQQSVATAQAKQTLTDPWVTLTPKGQIKLVFSQTAPKNVFTYGGQAITESEYTQIWKNTYADIYQSYTGKPASPIQQKQIIASGISQNGLAQKLAAQPGFQNSPTYKQHAKGFLAVGRSILGDKWNPGGDLKGVIKKAIVGNWDQATFEETLRQSKEYLQSPEYKTNLAQNTSAYQTIYGNPDAKVQAMLAQKTQAGWTPDELSSWLRTQPAYKNSAEYQSKSLSLLGSLGLITGAVPTLSEDQINKLLAAGNSLPAQAAAAAAGAVARKPPALVSENGAGQGGPPVVGPPPLVSENGQGMR